MVENLEKKSTGRRFTKEEFSIIKSYTDSPVYKNLSVKDLTKIINEKNPDLVVSTHTVMKVKKGYVPRGGITENKVYEKPQVTSIQDVVGAAKQFQTTVWPELLTETDRLLSEILETIEFTESVIIGEFDPVKTTNTVIGDSLRRVLDCIDGKK